MEASVNFQNVTGCDSSNLTSSQCPLECFLSKGSKSDLSSLVSGTSSSFLYPCPSPPPRTRNKTSHSALLFSHVNFHVFNICQVFTFNEMVKAPRNYIEHIKNEYQAHFPMLCNHKPQNLCLEHACVGLFLEQHL